MKFNLKDWMWLVIVVSLSIASYQTGYYACNIAEEHSLIRKTNLFQEIADWLKSNE